MKSAKKYWLLLLLILVLFVAVLIFFYPRPQKPQPEFNFPKLEKAMPGLSQSQKIADAVTEMLSYYGDNRQDLIKRFGEPKKITKQKVENLFNPKVIDELIIFVYDQIRFHVYHGTHDNSDFIVQVEIFSDKYPLSNGLRVGDGKEKILAALGKPSDMSQENIIYEGTLSRINFHLKNGIVDKIYVVRYID